MSVEDQDRADFIVSQLFQIMDADGNGVIDFPELATGLSVFCDGSPEDKARAAFNLYDYNGDGVNARGSARLGAEPPV
jgi:Ca2+-binding EF-hand superfamily protein